MQTLIFGYSPLATFRFATAILLGICAFQTLLMLSNYWHNVIPLRREVARGEIIAPPVVWAFVYHLLVFFLLVVLVVSRIQVAFRGDPPSFGTWAIPVLAVGLTVVVSRFQVVYARNLREGIHKRDG